MGRRPSSGRSLFSAMITQASDSSLPPISRRDAVRLLGLAGAASLALPQLLKAGEPASAPAPSLDGDEPGFHRFKIGALDAITLRDGGFSRPPDQSPIGVGEKPEKLQALLRDAFLATDKIEIPFNLLLVRTGSDLVLVDAGCGTLYGSSGGRLQANLAAAGVRPEHITGVILTHLHGDHFGGLFNPETGTPNFPNARVLIHRREYDFWSGNSPDLAAQFADCRKNGSVERVQGCLKALKDRWQFVAGGDKPFAGVEIVDAAGHTPGHIGVLFSSEQEHLIHFADTAHSHALSFARPEWKNAFDLLPDQAIATRRRLMERFAAERTRVFGGHMPFPSLGHVRARDHGFEFVIEPFPLA